jgi:hypothetical protein
MIIVQRHQKVTKMYPTTKGFSKLDKNVETAPNVGKVIKTV